MSRSAGSNLEASYKTAHRLAARIRKIDGVGRRLHPTGPRLPRPPPRRRPHSRRPFGLDQREVVSNLITALISNQMIAPSYWIDPRNGNDYMLTVQYPENQVRSIADLRAIPLRSAPAHATPPVSMPLPPSTA